MLTFLLILGFLPLKRTIKRCNLPLSSKCGIPQVLKLWAWGPQVVGAPILGVHKTDRQIGLYQGLNKLLLEGNAAALSPL